MYIIIIIKYLSQISTHAGVHALVCMCMRDREGGESLQFSSYLLKFYMQVPCAYMRTGADNYSLVLFYFLLLRYLPSLLQEMLMTVPELQLSLKQNQSMQRAVSNQPHHLVAWLGSELGNHHRDNRHLVAWCGSELGNHYLLLGDGAG